MSTEIHCLEPADKFLIAGQLAGAISVLLISIGQIWRLAGQLPTSPMFVGTAAPTQQSNKPSPSGSYWDR